MKKLLTEWRKYLITEAMKTPDDLPDGVHVEIEQRRGDLVGFSIEDTTTDAANGTRGFLAIKPTEAHDGECLNGYKVTISDATSGWGPMLYDLALEWASKHGGGLMSDRNEVSKSAFNVWEYYDNQRPDVESAQLDIRNKGDKNDADAFPDTNWDKLTPNTTTDDCEQHSSLRWSFKTSTEVWSDQPTSRIYRIKGTPTTTRLRKLGKLKKK
tara:strand:- start:91 stop:726 length:636 start_codon:yes stop_codon:yes gene_type:complete